MRTADLVRQALGRPEHDIDISTPLKYLRNKRVLIAGAAGAIGQPLTNLLRAEGVTLVPTDVDLKDTPWGYRHMDITQPIQVLQVVRFHKPDLIINLAAQKLAPGGESEPIRTFDINTNGVWNLLNTGVPLVQASTCKAINPETVYGASKLIAERMVLSYGGSVMRYVNVLEAGPSVLDIWQSVPEDEPLSVMDCGRYLITLKEALALTVWSCALPHGRYKLDAGYPVWMPDLATRLFPGREQALTSRRRGDRVEEPFAGVEEYVLTSNVPGISRVISYHDSAFHEKGRWGNP